MSDDQDAGAGSKSLLPVQIGVGVFAAFFLFSFITEHLILCLIIGVRFETLIGQVQKFI